MTTDFIKINHALGIPKYKQIINSIYQAIESGQLRRGDKVASINDICKKHSLSRDTVMMAFNEMKAKGIVFSIPGKGYYIESTEINFTHKVLLLFDELNIFKENLYNSFLENLNGKASVDIYFHHFNRAVFNSTILNNLDNYTIYVIMPAIFEDILPVLERLPQDKIYILDQIKPELKGKYPAVYQNFRKDVYEALVSGQDLLHKYDKLVMVFPGGKEPIGQLDGFKDFCSRHHFKNEVIFTLKNRVVKRGEAYIVPSDRDLVTLVKEARQKNYMLGKDFGIISYNDTALKEVVAGGITTISTDFRLMGKTLANLVLNHKNTQIENNSSLIRRSSL